MHTTFIYVFIFIISKHAKTTSIPYALDQNTVYCDKQNYSKTRMIGELKDTWGPVEVINTGTCQKKKRNKQQRI